MNKFSVAFSTPTNTPTPIPEIYKAAYAEPTQPQTNVPVSAAQANPGLWDESMYSEMFAEGGIASYQLGGDVNFNYPQADQHPNQFANQNQLPTAAMGVTKFEPRTDAMTGQMIGFAKGGNTANVPRYTGPGSSNSSPAYGTEAWFNQQFGKFISNLEPSPGSHSGLPTGLDTINPAFGMGYGPRPQQTMPQQTPARAYVSPPPPAPNTNIYHPEYQSYAEGDLVEQEQEKKSKLSNPLLEYYSRHTKAKEMMAKPDVGIFHDSDPDTRNLDAPQAALVRLRKQFGYSQMKQPKTNLKEMPSLGTLPGAQYQVQEAADGGIMGYSLGGYASGGNPRLLRGPGDGMSDNIPATIANRQPARLADGEFVVPADVVSHLGNGSTEAGAKHLHKMMDKVRVARTGKKKQGTQINPNKFLPA